MSTVALWVLALHLIGVVCWFAGLFYLPRLFVYHAITTEAAVKKQFIVMEHKLFFYIMWPSMLITLLSGFALMIILPRPEHWHLINWLSVKLFLVAILVVYHFFCHYYLAIFRIDQNQKSHKFFRVFNEGPTILLLSIVILAVVKPF